jgi:phosphatidylglycerophosphate synthase
MLANWITLSRIPLLLIWIMIFYLGSPSLRLAGVGLLFVGLILDTVDGMVARRTGGTSLLGSVLDIAADRTYELVLWVCFADRGLIPAAIPLIVVVRTTLTDALRSVGVAEGTAPFAQHRTGLARFIVGSGWVRTGYSVTKVAVFCGLALAHALSSLPAGTTAGNSAAPLLDALQVVAWLAVVLCIGRGLPVLIAGVPRLRGA